VVFIAFRPKAKLPVFYTAPQDMAPIGLDSAPAPHYDPCGLFFFFSSSSSIQIFSPQGLCSCSSFLPILFILSSP
jgi:hypothetical protein